MKTILNTLGILGLTTFSAANMATVSLSSTLPIKTHTNIQSGNANSLTQFHYIDSFGFAGYATPTFLQTFQSLLIAGSNRSGLWYSKDQGKSFVQDITIPKQADIEGMVNVDNKRMLTTFQNGQWTSTDGINWIKTSDYPTEHDIQVINGVIYLISNFKGVWQSFDGGKTFVKNTTLPLNLDPSSKIIAFNNQLFIATSYIGFYNSMDNGKTWQLVKSLPKVQYAKIALLDNDLYASGYKLGLWKFSTINNQFQQVANFPNLETITAMFHVNNRNYFQTATDGAGKGLYIELYNHFIRDLAWPWALSMTSTFKATNGHVYYGSDAGTFEHQPGVLLPWYELNKSLPYSASSNLFIKEINNILYVSIYFPGKVDSRIAGLYEANLNN